MPDLPLVLEHRCRKKEAVMPRRKGRSLTLGDLVARMDELTHHDSVKTVMFVRDMINRGVVRLDNKQLRRHHKII